MDEKFLEQADALMQGEIAAGIARARQREPMPDGFNGECDCGEVIPQPRVRLGYYRCVKCQHRLETYERHRK